MTSIAGTLAFASPALPQTDAFWEFVEGRKKAVSNAASNVISAFRTAKSYHSAFVKEFLNAAEQFIGAIERQLAGNVSLSISGLASAYGALKSIEKSVSNILADPQAPPELKAIARRIFSNLIRVMAKVVSVYEQLGGDPSKLPLLAKDFEPVPVIIPRDSKL